MKKCDCKPGTEANGWHEIRCNACKLKEREEFKKALSKVFR